MHPLKRNCDTVLVVDQRRLPHEVEQIEISDYRRMIEAITSLTVRGAPAIGFAGAYGVCLAVREALSLAAAERRPFLDQAIRALQSARPTAVNLKLMVKRVVSEIGGEIDNQLLKQLWSLVDRLLEEDYAAGRRIGATGAQLIENGSNYLTHCNAGGLATSGYGTALALFFSAAGAGKKFHVWVDETRPLLQGARITAWELREAEIPATLITDSMAGMLMQRGKVDGIVVGADRIAANGDSANKIGTMSLAVLAGHFEIPFWVVAPETTIDPTTACGDDIQIEERDSAEVSHFAGSEVAPEGMPVFNPAFDVTPAELITGIITEKGIHRPPFSFTVASN